MKNTRFIWIKVCHFVWPFSLPFHQSLLTAVWRGAPCAFYSQFPHQNRKYHKILWYAFSLWMNNMSTWHMLWLQPHYKISLYNALCGLDLRSNDRFLSAPYPQLAEIEVASADAFHQAVGADFAWCRQQAGQCHLVVHTVSTQHLHKFRGYFKWI